MVGLIDVTFREVSGEEKLCTPEMTASWKETHLPTILSRYELKNIFNADEFGRFHQNQCTSKSIDVQKGNSLRYV